MLRTFLIFGVQCFEIFQENLENFKYDSSISYEKNKSMKSKLSVQR